MIGSVDPHDNQVKNRDFVIEQYRRGTLVRTFAPSGDDRYPWAMHVNGKVYLRTHGWVLSKILATFVDGSEFMTKAREVELRGGIESQSGRAGECD